MTRSKETYQKKPMMIVWIIKSPLRALYKAKVFYVKGISNFSTSYSQPMMINEDANRMTMHLPRSFSTSKISNDHNHKQSSGGGLIRASSTSVTQINISDLERYITQKQQKQLQSCASRKGVPRSCSVGMGTIDEDRASSFRDDNILFKNKVVVKDNRSRFSRNLSHARDAKIRL